MSEYTALLQDARELSSALAAERLAHKETKDKVDRALEFMDDDAQYVLENEHTLRRELANIRKILNG